MTTNDGFNQMNTFRDLPVWQQAVDLYIFVKTKIRTLNNVPRLMQEMTESSAFSCSSVIAEEFCGREFQEEVHFSSKPLASLAENFSQVYTLYSGGDIDKDWFAEYETKYHSLEKKLTGYMKPRSLRLKKSKNKKHGNIVNDKNEPGLYDNENPDDWIVG